MDIHDTVVLRGRAGSDVTLFRPKENEDKRPYARFRLAVTRSWRKDDGTWEEGEARWYTIHAFGALAENAYKSVLKGLPVIVVGRPQAQAWLTKNGELRSEISINARTMGLDLGFGESIFRRSPSRQPVENSETPTGEGATTQEAQTEASRGDGVPVEEGAEDPGEAPEARVA